MKNYGSTIVGFAVLVVLMGAGTAQGLSGANTVFSDDIVDGNVTYADIKDGAVGGNKILNNAITSAKVYPNTLTGADINESTLSLPTAFSMSTDYACDGEPETVCATLDFELRSLSLLHVDQFDVSIVGGNNDPLVKVDGVGVNGLLLPEGHHTVSVVMSDLCGGGTGQTCPTSVTGTLQVVAIPTPSKS